MGGLGVMRIRPFVCDYGTTLTQKHWQKQKNSFRCFFYSVWINKTKFGKNHPRNFWAMKYYPKNANSCKGGWSWLAKLLTKSKRFLKSTLTNILVFNSCRPLLFLLFWIEDTFREPTFLKAQEKDANRYKGFFHVQTSCKYG